MAVSSVDLHARPLAITFTLVELFRESGSLTDDGAKIEVDEVTSADPHT